MSSEGGSRSSVRDAQVPDGDDLEGASPRVRRVGLLLGPLLFALALFGPFGSLDPSQRRVAAVTALTATWWITAALPIGATSLLPAALFPLLGVLGGREVAPMYMQDLVFLFLGAFVLALGVERWNVHRRVALWILSCVGTQPRRLVLGFMLASATLSLWINNTATVLLMLPIGMAVVASADPPDADPHGRSDRRGPFAVALLLGMAYSASVGGIGTPVGTAPNQVFLGQFRQLFPGGPEIPFGRWMLAFLPLVLVYVPIGWWILCRLALRVPAGPSRGAEAIAAERARLGRMGSGERRMAALFAATAFLWVTRADLDVGLVRVPGWARLVVPEGIEPAGYVTDATVGTAMAILAFLIPAPVPGAAGAGRTTRLMDWKTAARVPWEVLLLIGGGFAIARGFQASGLDEVLGASLGPFLAGRSDWVVVAVTVVFMAALTEITSNTATTAVLLPVLGQAAVSAGVSPLLTMVPATIAASCAFMLPVATPPNAVVFSSRLVGAPRMARVGLWMNVALAILVTLAFQLWTRRVLGIEGGLPGWAER